MSGEGIIFVADTCFVLWCSDRREYIGGRQRRSRQFSSRWRIVRSSIDAQSHRYQVSLKLKFWFQMHGWAFKCFSLLRQHPDKIVPNTTSPLRRKVKTVTNVTKCPTGPPICPVIRDRRSAHLFHPRPAHAVKHRLNVMSSPQCARKHSRPQACWTGS